jgi:hypothetical protein
MSSRILILFLLPALAGIATAQPFALNYSQPTLDRWMYAYNSDPAGRPTAPVFSTFGDAAGVDTRHGQFLVGFDTFAQIATNLGATNYLIRSARFKATTFRDNVFTYDATQDAAPTYYETNHPAYQADGDAGRPIELFGAGFRNGWTAETFLEGSAFGSNAAGQRNAYAAGYQTGGGLVDVGNNVGKTNAAFPRFEVHPFAVGQTTNVVPGAPVPADTRFTFELNLEDPLVRQYLQESLNAGRVRLMATWLGAGAFGGQPSYPDFYNKESVFGDPATLELDGAIISSADTDNDTLPDVWETFHFTNTVQTAGADFDADGADNRAEFLAGTDPVDAASRLKIVSFTRAGDGVTTVRFNFAASRGYALDYSTNLVNWSSVLNPVLTYYTAPGVVEWKDDGSQTGGLGGLRFYRVRLK